MTDHHEPANHATGAKTPPSGPPGWFVDTLRSASDLGLAFRAPVQPESRTVKVNGLHLRYLDWGNGHLPDLLFIHGFAQQAHSWDFAALAVQDLFHVVSLDMRGHGESEHAPGGAYSFDDLYADLDAFISATGLERPTLCGLSLGGTLSYMYASRNPSGVRALVIAEAAPETRREGRESIQSFVSGPNEFESLDELVAKVRELTPWRSPEQVRRSLVHSVGQTGSGNWVWKYDPAIRTLRDSHLSSEVRWEALKKITAPTLLVWGEESDVIDERTVAQMGELISGSLVVSIPRAGHRVSGDNPRDFNAALRRFLEQYALPMEGRRDAAQN